MSRQSGQGNNLEMLQDDLSGSSDVPVETKGHRPHKFNEKKVVILGAGVCGLGCATRLWQLGHTNFVLVDKAPHQGGLAHSVTDPQGFVWDHGCHVVFSHYNYFDQVLDALDMEWVAHKRNAWVFCDKIWVPFPFQNHIRHLSKEAQAACLDGLVECQQNSLANRSPPTSFEEHNIRLFGKGLCDVFMRPYNFKVWAHPATTMNPHWIGERVAPVDIKKVISNVLSGKDENRGWGPHSQFRFPRKGGNGAVWEKLITKFPSEVFKLGSGVQEINGDTKEVILESGERIKYDYLVTTAPLNVTLGTLLKASWLDASVRSLADGFVWSTVSCVGIGVEMLPEDMDAPGSLANPKSDDAEMTWMYFPNDDCPFYRACFLSFLSPEVVPIPGKQYSILCEVSESVHRPAEADIIQACIQGCRNTGLLREGHKIISTWHARLPHGYPTPWLGRDAVLDVVQPLLQKHDIISRGRFGGWKYEVANQDHVFMQGVEAAEYLLYGIPEMTYFHPNLVNSRKETCRKFKTFTKADGWLQELVSERAPSPL